MKQFLPSKLRVSHGTKIWSLLLLIGLATLPGCVNSSLQSIQVLPATGAQLSAAGATLQFKAIGTYSHGSHLATTQDITGLVSWTSSNEGAATVNSSGMATALSTGNATISANGKGSFLGVTGSAALAVAISGSSTGPRVLSSITMVPAAQTITSLGSTAQFIAMGTFSSAPITQDLSSTAIWTSTVTSVATVDSSGLATAIAAGTSTVTASVTSGAGTVTGSAPLTVTATAPPAVRDLMSISIVPGSQTISIAGGTAQFVAIGNYSIAPLTADLTASATWGSTVVGVATITSGLTTCKGSTTCNGLATGAGAGTSTITASSIAPVSGAVITTTATLVVTAAATPGVRELTSITMFPGSQSIGSIGGTAQFVAIGNYSSAPFTQDDTAKVVWTSSEAGVASIVTASQVAGSPTTYGLATATGVGTSAITASETQPGASAIIATTTMTVTGAQPPTLRTLISIAIVPLTQTVASIGGTAKFVAIGTYSSAPLTADLTGTATWVSTQAGVATIDNTGLASTLGVGTTAITASFPIPASQGQPAGIVITSATLTVTGTAPPAVRALTSITITQASQTIASIGGTAQYQAVGNFSNLPLTEDLTGLVLWTSSEVNVATINPTSGLATGLSIGSSAITANYPVPAVPSSGQPAGVMTTSATVTVTGTAPPIANDLLSITIVPGSQTLASLGLTAQYIAIGNYSSPPLTQDVTETVFWRSSETSVASISNGLSRGLATAVGMGTSTITASMSSTAGALITTSAAVTVTASSAPGLVSIAIVPASQSVTQVGEAAQFIAIGTYNGVTPATKEITSDPGVTWTSADVSVATINNRGLATGNGTGTTAITASMLSAGPGTTLIYGTAAFTETSGTPPVAGVSTLAVYQAGTGTGTISASYIDPQGTSTLILGPLCVSGPLCVGVVPTPTTVTITATPTTGVFGGWSTNCTEVAGTPTMCTLPMTASSGNQTVAAIFN